MDELLKEERLEELVQAMLGAFEQFEPGTTANDQKAQFEAIRRMALAEKEIQAILAEQDAAVKALLGKKGDGKESSKDNRVKTLLKAYEFCARRRDVAKDVLGDVNTYNKITKQMIALAKEFEEIKPDWKLLLVPFLDHTNAAVRASAAEDLVKLMPERALPVLRQLEEEHRGTSAGMIAYWAIAMHEHPLPENWQTILEGAKKKGAKKGAKKGTKKRT